MNLGELKYTITATTAPLTQKLGEAKKAISSTDQNMKSAGKSISDSTQKMSGKGGANVGELTGQLSSVSPAAGQAVQGFQKMSMAARAFQAALGPVGLVLMALGAAITALTSYFKGSVDGQEKMARIMGTLNGLMTVLKDAAIEVGRWIVWAFENPQEAVKQLWEVIKQNIINRFQGMIEMVQAGWEVISKGASGAAQAIRGIFDKSAREEAKKLFKEAGEAMLDFGQAAFKAASGIDNIGEKVAGVWDKVNEKAKEGSDIGAREIELRQQQIKSLTEIAKLDAQIAEARRIANDDTEETSTQLIAMSKAMELANEKFDIQAGLARQALKIQQDKNALGESNLDDLEKAAQLESELIRLDAQRDDYMRSLLRRQTTLMNRKGEEGEMTQEQLSNEIEMREKVLEAIRKAGRSEIEVLQEAMNEKLDMFDWTEEERVKIVQFYQDQIDEIHQKAIDKQLEAERAANDQRIAEERRVQEEKTQMQMDTLHAFATSMSVLSQMQMAAMNHELKMAGDNEAKKEAIHKKYAKRRKAISMSEAIIGTAKAVINALQTQPFLPMGPIMAGLAGAMGAAQIATIAAAPMKTGGIVPPGFPNDTYPAMLTSGETVIPAPMPLPSAQQGPMTVRWVRAGSDLLGFINEETRRQNV